MKATNNTASGPAEEAAATGCERHIIPVSDEEWEAAVKEFRARAVQTQKQKHIEQVREARQLLLESVGTAFC